MPGPRLDRVLVRRHFRGELEGESSGQLLMCQAMPGGSRPESVQYAMTADEHGEPDAA